jgi:hypothetical protein
VGERERGEVSRDLSITRIIAHFGSEVRNHYTFFFAHLHIPCLTTMGATLLVGGCALCFEINVPKGECECRCSTKMGRGSEGKDQNVTYINIYTRKL